MANNLKKYASDVTLANLADKIKELFVKKTDLNTELAKKANSSHTHSIADTTNLQSTLDSKVPTSRTINSKPLSANITLSASDVGAAPSSVQTTLGTVSDTLNAHTSNSDIHFTADERTKLSGIQSGAQVNTITGVKGNSETSYRTGNVNITKANIGLGNVDNTADANKSVKHAATADSATSATKATQDASGNVITSTYETKSAANSKLTEAKNYTDEKVANLLNNSTEAVDSIYELRDAMEDNADAIEALNQIAAGKANATHAHAISDITNLQSALDGKANSSHGTHVSYSTTVPVMDGTASVGTATTVARSDHKHPTDTSRASKTEFDSHNSDTTKHITSTERTNWNAAKTHADSAHAPSNAEPNQNAFSNIAVSGQTTVAADSKTDTLTFEGSNVSITTDATNDKVTFAVADATTSAKGVVKLSDSVTSDSSTTAATSYSVRAAYNLAGNAYDLANSKADYTHNHTVSQIGDLTVSASELNYMDGVTSNVQAQLDGKQSSITGGASTIASSNLTANRALVSNANGKVGVSLVTATELGYLDGVTSNIQDQLDDKAAYSHNHSASHITSGIMDAARLPDASETAAGIVNTETQSFAGNKTFTGKVTAAGVASNGHITAGTANTYDIGTSLSPFKRIYTQDLYVDAKVVAGSVLDGGSFVKETDGTTTTKGITRLTVGNYIAKGKNGNAEGRITIYNENNGSVTLRTSHTDSATPTIFLPDHMGTLVTENDIAGLASVATVTTAEYSALEEAEATNANTLYMITDAEEEVIPQIQFITWEEND